MWRDSTPDWARSPRYAALTQPQPLSLAEIQQQALDRRYAAPRVRARRKARFLWLVSHKLTEWIATSFLRAPNWKPPPAGFPTTHRASETLGSAQSAIDHSSQDAQQDVARPGGSATQRQTVSRHRDGRAILSAFRRAAIAGRIRSDRPEVMSPLIAKHGCEPFLHSVLSVIRREMAGRQRATGSSPSWPTH